MIIYGSIKGFDEKEVNSYGFPLDGIQLCLDRDLIHEEFVFTFGTDLFLDIFSSEYCIEGRVLNFKCKCESLMVDGEETDLEINGDLVHSMVRASKITELILSGDYSNYVDPMEQERLKNLKVLGSIEFRVGSRVIHKKCNKVKFY